MLAMYVRVPMLAIRPAPLKEKYMGQRCLAEFSAL